MQSQIPLEEAVFLTKIKKSLGPPPGPIPKPLLEFNITLPKPSFDLNTKILSKNPLLESTKKVSIGTNKKLSILTTIPLGLSPISRIAFESPEIKKSDLLKPKLEIKRPILELIKSKLEPVKPISESIYKFSQDKHNKYVEFYNTLNKKDTEYWGIGLENESYLMFENLYEVNKNFLINNHKRERYSVNYWENYNIEKLNKTLELLPDKVYLPIYLNGYLFQKTDYYGEPMTRYTKLAEPNPKFIGKTINDILKDKSYTYNLLFDKNMIFDGDTFEFTTFDFYKTTVTKCIEELKDIKKMFLKEINNVLVNQKDKNLNSNYIFNQKIIYPPFNFGFVKFQTNLNNLAICNNGTYHINITLPTLLNSKNEIGNTEKFKDVHSNAIRAIQWIEPLLIALYGSPDIFNVLNKDYAAGSLRLAMSRYIGIGTYDSYKMEKGKMLNDFKYKGTAHYFNKLHDNSPYEPPNTIGYDFNYNKFSKHGIELRIFDYFPEEYLEDILNFIILVCQFSITTNIPDPKEDIEWNNLCIDCIKNGSDAIVIPGFYLKLYDIFDTLHVSCLSLYKKKNKSVLKIANKLAKELYKHYHDFSICKKMSPNMKRVELVDYNSRIRNNFKILLKKTE